MKSSRNNRDTPISPRFALVGVVIMFVLAFAFHLFGHLKGHADWVGVVVDGFVAVGTIWLAWSTVSLLRQEESERDLRVVEFRSTVDPIIAINRVFNLSGDTPTFYYSNIGKGAAVSLTFQLFAVEDRAPFTKKIPALPLAAGDRSSLEFAVDFNLGVITNGVPFFIRAESVNVHEMRVVTEAIITPTGNLMSMGTEALIHNVTSGYPTI